jgi:hypothetical protein
MRVRNASHHRTQQIHASPSRATGKEAPMVIGPSDVARLLRQLRTIIRGTKK